MRRAQRILHSSALAVILVGCAEGESPYDGPLLRLATPGNVVGSISTAVRDEHVAIAWFATIGADTAVFVSRSLDGGNSFSIEQRISPVGERTMHNPDEAPGVELILDPDGFAQPFLAWTRSLKDSAEIVWSYTIDGTTYSKPAMVPGSAGRGTRRLRALQRDTTDRVFATWDARESAPSAGPAAGWRGSTDGSLRARPLDATDALPGSARSSSTQPLEAQISGTSRFRVWADPTRTPPMLLAQVMHSSNSGGSELASAVVTLGAGTDPVFVFPNTGPVLVWISHRAAGREINVIRVR